MTRRRWSRSAGCTLQQSPEAPRFPRRHRPPPARSRPRTSRAAGSSEATSPSPAPGPASERCRARKKVRGCVARLLLRSAPWPAHGKNVMAGQRLHALGRGGCWLSSLLDALLTRTRFLNCGLWVLSSSVGVTPLWLLSSPADALLPRGCSPPCGSTPDKEVLSALRGRRRAHLNQCRPFGRA